jgi:hypothetical protein
MAGNKEIARKVQFESKTSPGKFHEVIVYADNSMSCNCKGWIFSAGRNGGARECKHTKQVTRDYQEYFRAPTGGGKPTPINVAPGVIAVADASAMAMIDQVLGSYKQALEGRSKPKAGYYYERRDGGTIKTETPRKQPRVVKSNKTSTKPLTEAIKPEEKPIPVTVVLARPRRVFNFEE